MEPLLDVGDDQDEERSPSFAFVVKDGKLVKLALPSLAPAEATVFRGRCCCMTPDHPIRGAVIRLTSTAAFRDGILLVVLLNCAYMLFEPAVLVPETREAAVATAAHHP